eukprot:TRINITY_DN9490_c1_g2_i1.p1 TRINITY_DN9490_c1_g2~~TRINITY_DN9490_c1_g2_i1.p1  ORF type:complete len:1213 (+),score=307.64 TRINITY_DN9490_c1_g2_i1:412-3639(+)
MAPLAVKPGGEQFRSERRFSTFTTRNFDAMQQQLLEEYFLKQRELRRTLRKIITRQHSIPPAHFFDPVTGMLLLDPVRIPQWGGITVERLTWQVHRPPGQELAPPPRMQRIAELGQEIQGWLDHQNEQLARQAAALEKQRELEEQAAKKEVSGRGRRSRPARSQSRAQPDTAAAATPKDLRGMPSAAAFSMDDSESEDELSAQVLAELRQQIGLSSRGGAAGGDGGLAGRQLSAEPPKERGDSSGGEDEITDGDASELGAPLASWAGTGTQRGRHSSPRTRGSRHVKIPPGLAGAGAAGGVKSSASAAGDDVSSPGDVLTSPTMRYYRKQNISAMARNGGREARGQKQHRTLVSPSEADRADTVPAVTPDDPEQVAALVRVMLDGVEDTAGLSTVAPLVPPSHGMQGQAAAEGPAAERGSGSDRRASQAAEGPKRSRRGTHGQKLQAQMVPPTVVQPVARRQSLAALEQAAAVHQCNAKTAWRDLKVKVDEGAFVQPLDEQLEHFGRGSSQLVTAAELPAEIKKRIRKLRNKNKKKAMQKPDHGDAKRKAPAPSHPPDPGPPPAAPPPPPPPERPEPPRPPPAKQPPKAPPPAPEPAPKAPPPPPPPPQPAPEPPLGHPAPPQRQVATPSAPTRQPTAASSTAPTRATTAHRQPTPPSSGPTAGGNTPPPVPEVITSASSTVVGVLQDVPSSNTGHWQPATQPSVGSPRRPRRPKRRLGPDFSDIYHLHMVQKRLGRGVAAAAEAFDACRRRAQAQQQQEEEQAGSGARFPRPAPRAVDDNFKSSLTAAALSMLRANVSAAAARAGCESPSALPASWGSGQPYPSPPPWERSEREPPHGSRVDELAAVLHAADALGVHVPELADMVALVNGIHPRGRQLIAGYGLPWSSEGAADRGAPDHAAAAETEAADAVVLPPLPPPQPAPPPGTRRPAPSQLRAGGGLGAPSVSRKRLLEQCRAILEAAEDGPPPPQPQPQPQQQQQQPPQGRPPMPPAAATAAASAGPETALVAAPGGALGPETAPGEAHSVLTPVQRLPLPPLAQPFADVLGAFTGRKVAKRSQATTSGLLYGEADLSG